MVHLETTVEDRQWSCRRDVLWLNYIRRKLWRPEKYSRQWLT